MKINKKYKRRIFDAVSLVFWICMLVIARQVRFKWEENPGLVSIMLGGLVLHVFIYQARLSKLKKRKKEIKSQNINDLKKEIVLNLYKETIPDELASLKPLVEKWGVENTLLREDLYENSSRNELWNLKEQLESKMKEIERFIQEENKTTAQIAFENTYNAYNDLGLWTWEKESI